MGGFLVESQTKNDASHHHSAGGAVVLVATLSVVGPALPGLFFLASHSDQLRGDLCLCETHLIGSLLTPVPVFCLSECSAKNILVQSKVDTV